MIDYLLTSFFLLISVIGGGKSKAVNHADDLFSKDYTIVLKGICCIVVVMVHVKVLIKTHYRIPSEVLLLFV